MDTDTACKKRQHQNQILLATERKQKARALEQDIINMEAERTMPLKA